MSTEEDDHEFPIQMTRVPALESEMRRAILAMSRTARMQIAHEVNKWRATYRYGREVIGVLNRRYDLWVFECARPAPWIAAGFDTQPGKRALVFAALLPRGKPVTCRECAEHVARAVTEPITQVKCYDE
jgi:hypothetical protein